MFYLFQPHLRDDPETLAEELAGIADLLSFLFCNKELDEHETVKMAAWRIGDALSQAMRDLATINRERLQSTTSFATDASEPDTKPVTNSETAGREAVDVDAIARSLNTDRATVEGILRQLKTPPPASGVAGKPRSCAVNG